MTANVLRAATWFAILLALAVILRTANAGALATPPMVSVDELLAWVDARTPATTALALARLLAECGTWYLIAISALRAAAWLTASDALSRIADGIALRAARRAVRAGLGLGVSAAVSLPIVGDGAILAPVPAAASEAPSGSATMRPTPPRADPPAGTASMRPDAPDPPRPPVERQPRGGPVPITWTVSPGESFWTIAEDVVSAGRGDPPSAGEVARYWADLIDRNRHRLVAPSDPDLILPGQVFELPEHTPVRD